MLTPSAFLRLPNLYQRLSKPLPFVDHSLIVSQPRSDTLWTDNHEQGVIAIMRPSSRHECANCFIEFSWPSTVVERQEYCCAGCARGGPCVCTYPSPGAAPMLAAASRSSKSAGLARVFRWRGGGRQGVAEARPCSSTSSCAGRGPVCQLFYRVLLVSLDKGRARVLLRWLLSGWPVRLHV